MADRAPVAPGRRPPPPPAGTVACPFCDSLDTEMLSPFGGQLSVSQHWCRACRTGFDFLKWEAREPRP